MTDAAAALAAQRRWLAHRRDPASTPDLVVGLAASFTAEPLEAFLGAYLLEAGVTPDFSVAEYNQIFQVCFDPDSTLGRVDRAVILWRLEDLFEHALEGVCAGEAAATSEIVETVSQLGQAIAAMVTAVNYPVVVSVPPFPRPLGVDISDSLVGLRLLRVHAAAVEAFLAALDGAPVRWADLNAWQLAAGLDAAHDVVKSMVYRQPYTTRFWQQIGVRIGEILLRETRPAPKCVVLDCDNTLWGGVVGEDGVGGIALGTAFPGSAFQAFQRTLRSLKQRGVLLAIASKNNPAEVDAVFDQHDDMALRRDDIAARRVNWNPKSQSLREIAAELNIGIDALVMIDDSDYELAEIANGAPEVARLQVPEELGLLPDLLASSGLFRNMTVSAEDLARTDMIQQEAARKQAASAMTRAEFLASLGLAMEYITVSDEHVGRVAQLTNKTNQFNLTTIRRTEADIRALLADDDHLVRAMRVEDKFGDYGLVGVAILGRRDGDEWEIDTLLMSCRVLSRGIESAFLASLAEDAASRGARTLLGRYVQTAKNPLVASLYPDHDFVAVGDGLFRVDVKDVPATPGHVAVR